MFNKHLLSCTKLLCASLRFGYITQEEKWGEELHVDSVEICSLDSSEFLDVSDAIKLKSLPRGLLCSPCLSPLLPQSLACCVTWPVGVDQPPPSSGLFDGPTKKEEGDPPWDYLHGHLGCNGQLPKPGQGKGWEKKAGFQGPFPLLFCSELHTSYCERGELPAGCSSSGIQNALLACPLPLLSLTVAPYSLELNHLWSKI